MAEPVESSAADGQAQGGAVSDIRPLVARSVGNRGLLFFGALALAAGGGMFYALQMHRMELANPSRLAPQGEGSDMIASPPELSVPPAPDYTMPQFGNAGPYGAGGSAMTGSYGSGTLQQQGYRQAPAQTANREMAAPPGPVAPVSYQPAPMMQPSPASYGSSGPGVAYQAANPELPPGQDKPGEKAADGRVKAHSLLNPSTTVPQGSVIQAVMETALDSTRAGFARAIVSHDVRGFDGSRVLIPRGSRLFGAYQSDVSSGQKRAMIQWQRLTRPDGSLIDLDSPSADPLGRAGIKGKVNNHFFARYSSAILQSLLDIGVRRASQASTGDTIVVGLSNTSNSTASPVQTSSDIKPTLTVPQGASISVFAARDLDFTAVE